MVSAGSMFSLAVLSNANVYVWGQGDFGQIGNGADNSVKVPVQIGIIARKISAGDFHSLALEAPPAIEEQMKNKQSVSLGSSIFVNKITLLLPVEQKIQYAMYDICGRVVLTRGESLIKGKLDINVSKIKQGVYFLVVKTAVKKSCFKVIKLIK
jgi:hypothetical protein